MPMTGDFAKIGRLERNLETIARVPSKVARRAAPAITGALKRQFASGRDAYGNPWAPLAASTVRRKGFDTILVETGAGRDGTRAYPMGGAGIAIEVGPHLAWHMVQGDNRPARQVLPTGPLPKEWREILDRFSMIELGRHFSG